MNACQIVGNILDVEVVGKSKLITIQYGRRLKPKGSGAHPENIVVVRVPRSLLDGHHKDEVNSLEVGDWVEVYGRVQGLIHRRANHERLSQEVVVSRITRPEFIDDFVSDTREKKSAVSADGNAKELAEEA